MANVLNGQWGYYYPYVDETGKKRGLKILNWVYSKYYEPGYLTDELIEEMLADKIVTFDVPGIGTITARIIPYTNKKGMNTRIIQFNEPEDGKSEDHKLILANAEKIATSYWDSSSGWFNYRRPQEVINKLDLSTEWKTFAKEVGTVGNNRYGNIKVYKSRSRKGDNIELYCEVDTIKNSCEMITEEKYKTLMAQKEEKEAAAREIRKKYRDELKVWLSAISSV